MTVPSSSSSTDRTSDSQPSDIVIRPVDVGAANAQRMHRGHRRSDEDEPAHTRRWPRSPAFSAAAFAALGVTADANSEWTASLWLGLVGVALLLVVWSQRRSQWIATALLGVAIAATFAAWHHDQSSLRSSSDITRWLKPTRQAARIRGQVVSLPTTTTLDRRGSTNRVPATTDGLLPPNPVLAEPSDASPLQAEIRTSFELDVSAIATQADDGEITWLPATGRLWVQAPGTPPTATYRESIELLGVLVAPDPASNPGESDRFGALRRRGCRGFFRVVHPAAVSSLREPLTAWDLGFQQLARLRQWCEARLLAGLPEHLASLGQAVLLGQRSGLDPELREAFMETGTLHLLAVSGLNISVLWGTAWLTARVIRLPDWLGLTLGCAGLVIYGLLLESNAPILRAFWMGLLTAIAPRLHRSATGCNLLGVATLLILILRPRELFELGTQLSILAILCLQTRGQAQVMDQERMQPLPPPYLWWPHRRQVALRAAAIGGQELFTGLLIWGVSTPLIASQTNLYAPAGLIVTCLLGPIATLMIVAGSAGLLVSLVSPWLAQPLFGLFAGLLQLVVWTIRWAADTPGSHFYAAGPPVWWLIGGGLIAAWTMRWIHRPIAVRHGLAAATVWLVAGLTIGLWPTSRDSLRVTVISVGHGLATLLECPNGRTLLYDAGSLGSGDRTAEVISRCVWARNKARLDAIVLSHADSDHLNAVPELSERLPIGTALYSRQLLWSRSQSAAAAVDALARRATTTQLLHAGQSITLDPTVELDCLHPSVDFGGSSDNARSVLLRVRFGARTLLLTGDLELEGLTELMNSPREPVDVLLSPHHGSARSNTRQLAEWAAPAVVVSSQGRNDSLAALAAAYGDSAEILTTATHGAITLEFHPDGRWTATPFRRPESIAVDQGQTGTP